MHPDPSLCTLHPSFPLCTPRRVLQSFCTHLSISPCTPCSKPLTVHPRTLLCAHVPLSVHPPPCWGSPRAGQAVPGGDNDTPLPRHQQGGGRMTAPLQKKTPRASRSHCFISTFITQIPFPADGGERAAVCYSPSCFRVGAGVSETPTHISFSTHTPQQGPSSDWKALGCSRAPAASAPPLPPALLLLKAPGPTPERVIFSLSAIYTNTGTSKTGALQIWHFEVSAKWGNVDKEEKNMCKKLSSWHFFPFMSLQNRARFYELDLYKTILVFQSSQARA